MADDDVQLTDLEVIQRYSLAVRGASASRTELVAALQADLAWLQAGRRSPAKAAPVRTGAATASDDEPKPAAKKVAKRAPAKRTAAKG